MAAVPAQVVVGTIRVTVAVGLIVFLVVGHEVVETKPIMRSDEIDALMRPIGLMKIAGEKIVAAIKPLQQRPDFGRFAADEGTHVVAKTAVPLQPGHSWKSAT